MCMQDMIISNESIIRVTTGTTPTDGLILVPQNPKRIAFTAVNFIMNAYARRLWKMIPGVNALIPAMPRNPSVYDTNWSDGTTTTNGTITQSLLVSDVSFFDSKSTVFPVTGDFSIEMSGSFGGSPYHLIEVEMSPEIGDWYYKTLQAIRSGMYFTGGKS